MRVLSTLAVQGVLSGLLSTPGASTGSAPEPVFEPTALLAQRVRRGEHFDVAILTSDGIDALIRDDLLDARSKVDVAVSKVGIAVRAGAAKPDISTLETVRALLLAVPSLCYSKAGASGIFFAKVIRQLGIADEVERKATIIPSGFTAEQIVNGRCEIAIQQLSELLVVPGHRHRRSVARADPGKPHVLGSRRTRRTQRAGSRPFRAVNSACRFRSALRA